jgi:hypothetical protein
MKKWDIPFIRRYGEFHWLKEGEKMNFPNGGIIFQGIMKECEPDKVIDV